MEGTHDAERGHKATTKYDWIPSTWIELSQNEEEEEFWDFLNFPLRYLIMKEEKKGGSPTSELFGF